MGGKLVKQPASLISFTDIFIQHFPYYLSYGMSSKEYWDGDSTFTNAYRKAYKLRWEDRNRELWLQGEYVYEAILNVAPVLHAFAKRGTKPGKYPDKPHEIFPEKPKESDEVKVEKQKSEIMQAKMQSFADKFNKKFKEKQRGD